MEFIPAFHLGFWNAWILLLPFTLIAYFVTRRNPELSRKMMHPTVIKLIPSVRRSNQIYGILFPLAMIYSIFLPLRSGTPWFVVGVIIYSLGLVMMVVAMSDFRKAAADELVTWGVYKYSRHPMSLSLVLALVGIGTSSASWVLLIISLVIFVIANIIVSSEESYHLHKHGEEYRKYLHRTPKWLGIPRVQGQDQLTG